MVRRLFIASCTSLAMGSLALGILSHSRPFMFSYSVTSRNVLALHSFDGRIRFLWVETETPVMGVEVGERPDLIRAVPDRSAEEDSSADAYFEVTSRADLARFRSPWHGTLLMKGFGFSLNLVRYVRVPYWLVAGLLALPLVLPIASRQARQRYRRRRGLCLKCGYNLTGNTTGVCPECGTALLAQRLLDRPDHGNP